jgi:hypothetical protein
MVDYVSTTSKQLDFVAGSCRDRRSQEESCGLWTGASTTPHPSILRVARHPPGTARYYKM